MEKLNNDQLQELLLQIDFKPLAETISKHLGYHIEFEHSFERNRHDQPYIELKSNCLIKHTGIMESVCDKFMLSSFGGGISNDQKRYWMPINFSFHYQSGGSNGTSLATSIWSFEDKKWTISFGV